MNPQEQCDLCGHFLGAHGGADGTEYCWNSTVVSRGRLVRCQCPGFRPGPGEAPSP